MTLSSGLYEQLIDELMRRELSDLDPTQWSWDQETIDATDPPNLLLDVELDCKTMKCPSSLQPEEKLASTLEMFNNSR